MRPVLIGAGRGSRLEHQTDELPKTLVPVMERPMLEWILESLGAAGFTRKDVIFICGYRADVLRARYPEFTYVENTDWENNNILASLMYAREHLGRRLRLVVHGHPLSRLGREGSRRRAVGQGPRLRHRLAPPLRAPHEPPRERRREDERRGEASSTSRAPSRRERRPASSSASRSSRPTARRELMDAYDDAKARLRDARRSPVPEGVPDPPLPAHDPEGLDLPPRRHARRVHGARYAPGPRVREVLVGRRLVTHAHVVPELFPTTVVGSLPRPLWLKRLFDGITRGVSRTLGRERLLDLAVPSRSGSKRRRASTSSPTASGAASRTSR